MENETLRDVKKWPILDNPLVSQRALALVDLFN
jgi:hypothetical protein